MNGPRILSGQPDPDRMSPSRSRNRGLDVRAARLARYLHSAGLIAGQYSLTLFTNVLQYPYARTCQASSRLRFAASSGAGAGDPASDPRCRPGTLHRTGLRRDHDRRDRRDRDRLPRDGLLDFRIETLPPLSTRGPFDLRRPGGAADPRSGLGPEDAQRTRSPSPAQDPGGKRTVDP